MKAVGMYSGGLDSLLAASIMRREGFEVIAAHFYHGFNGCMKRELEQGPDQAWTPEPSVCETASRLGFTLEAADVSREFIPILLNPAHGYGVAANPCIDCHVFFARKAREIMEREGAAFVFSGEVVGQRPMSQHRPLLKHVENASGLAGRLLRPLSAKVLEETAPERDGLVNRERLYGFSGRSRKPQIELAREFGIDVIPQPAGGCMLTDRSFGNRFKDMAGLPGKEPTTTELYALKTGRHLRLPGGLRVVVGRNEAENNYLSALLAGTAWRFQVDGAHAGAEVFALGDPTPEETGLIAAIAARYSKGRDSGAVSVQIQKGTHSSLVTVQPSRQEDIDPLLLHYS